MVRSPIGYSHYGMHLIFFLSPTDERFFIKRICIKTISLNITDSDIQTNISNNFDTNSLTLYLLGCT